MKGAPDDICLGLRSPLYILDEVAGKRVGGTEDLRCCQDEVLSPPCGSFSSANEAAPVRHRRPGTMPQQRLLGIGRTIIFA